MLISHYKTIMYRRFIKPIIDFIVSLFLIIILLPIMLIVLIITYLNLGNPIFNERRLREGKNKKIFVMYKFRTKLLGKHEYNKVSKIIDNYRLNELPQLFNVLKGDMALVGPRPFIPNDDLPKDKISEKRYMVKPGITGLAQVNGGRSITHQEKLKYDIEYYDNISFGLDFKIILKTFNINNFK